MSKQAYQDFKKNWLHKYREIYKTGNNEQKRHLKDAMYSKVNLKVSEKDHLWRLITRI